MDRIRLATALEDRIIMEAGQILRLILDSSLSEISRITPIRERAVIRVSSIEDDLKIIND